MAAEYEFKYRLDSLSLMRLKAAFPQEETAIQMQTTYYDTPSGALSAQHYTLRRRLENDKSVCTLKTPSGLPSGSTLPAGSARNEWEVECEDIAQAIDRLIAQGAPEDLRTLTKEGLLPVCGAKFVRLAKTVTLNNAVAEIAMDSGYLFGGNQTAPLWEVEWELKSGDPYEFGSYVHSLATEFRLNPESQSKFARALKLYKGE